MKSLAIIGSNGTLGSDLVRYFEKKYIVTPIDKENYISHKGKSFDILINANGNSRRYWANENPILDFDASVESVVKSLFEFNSKKYIYISSIAVYGENSNSKNSDEKITIDMKKLSPYGFHKFLAEVVVTKYHTNSIIIRPSNFLGINLRKGPVYDLVNHKPLYISQNSKIQTITTTALAEIIDTLISNKVTNEIINVGGISTFSYKNAKKYFSNIKIVKDTPTQNYEMNIDKLNIYYKNLKTSEEYLKDYLKDIQYSDKSKR